MRKGNPTTTLDPTRRSYDAAEFENALHRKIVGQDQAIEKMTELYQMFVAGLNPPGRCEEVWRQISNYVDDEVDPELRAIMASHFKGCAHCSAIVDGMRNVVKLVGDGKAFEIPASASKKFYDKLNAHLANRQPKKR
jgi:hypothetical protein